MSNSLGVIKSSTSLDAVKTLQPKMFLEQESNKDLYIQIEKEYKKYLANLNSP